MESKNLILAVAISIIVMVGWTYLSQEMGWAPSQEELAQQQAATQAQNLEAAVQESSASPATEVQNLPRFTPAPGQDVIIDTPLYRATFYSGGGILRSFELKQYAADLPKEPLFTFLGFSFGERSTVAPDTVPPRVNLISENTARVAPLGLLINGQPSWSTGAWSFNGQNINLAEGSASLEFVGEVDGMRVVREMTFYADTYQITENVHFTNLGEQVRSVRVGYSVAEDSANAASGYYDGMRIAYLLDNSYEEEMDVEVLSTQILQQSGNIAWAATASTYFMSAVAPTNFTNLTLKAVLEDSVYRVVLEQSDIVVQANGEAEQSTTYWVGPKSSELLSAAPNDLQDSINLGMFGLIGSLLLKALNYFQTYAGNWGVSIIILTVVIKALFWPLTAKSYDSMAKMRKIQPMIMAIREKHGDDREAITRETMELQKTYGVNPLSGCVPMLVQLPVFIGLYQALLSSIELRGASFIDYLPGTDLPWLSDLSAADPFFITPLLMGASMFFMQKMSPPMGDPMQQKIMMFLPIIFTFLFLSFPSGLVLYWLVNNLLSMLQQWLRLRKIDN